MAKNKLQRFKENAEFQHVFEPNYATIEQDNFEQKGQWSAFFGNDNALTVELGCGKGEYTVALAEMYPDRNFIGIDLKGARLWVGAKYAKEKGLKNVAFIRSRVDFVEALFSPEEISEIWITFPDPQNKKRRKRLTAPPFLNRYRKLLKAKGILNLKTDSEKLFRYTLAVLEANNLKTISVQEDIHHQDKSFNKEELQIKTFYESLFVAEDKPIYYLSTFLENKDLIDAEFDETLYENARAIIPHNRKPDTSKLTF